MQVNSKTSRPTFRSILIVYCAIWPLVMVVPRAMQAILGEWPLVAEQLTTMVIVLLMTYVMMPLVNRIFALVQGAWIRREG